MNVDHKTNYPGKIVCISVLVMFSNPWKSANVIYYSFPYTLTTGSRMMSASSDE